MTVKSKLAILKGDHAAIKSRRSEGPLKKLVDMGHTSVFFGDTVGVAFH
jgi:hypothetical protein